MRTAIATATVVLELALAAAVPAAKASVASGLSAATRVGPHTPPR
jgi:hypothetical protein